MSVSIETTEVPTPAAAPIQIPSLGSKSRMPEFSLAGKVVLVSGAGRGLGLVQAEALLEAGAIVYALDRLEEPVSIPTSTALSTGYVYIWTPSNTSHTVPGVFHSARARGRRVEHPILLPSH